MVLFTAILFGIKGIALYHTGGLFVCLMQFNLIQCKLEDFGRFLLSCFCLLCKMLYRPYHISLLVGRKAQTQECHVQTAISSQASVGSLLLGIISSVS